MLRQLTSAVLVMVCVTPWATAAFNANVVTDFSATSNSNGAWAYGYSPTLGGAITLYTDTWPTPTDITANPGITDFSTYHGWYDKDYSSSSTYFAPSVWKRDTVSDAVFFHPGEGGEYSIFRLTVPVAGFYNLQALFFDADPTANGATTDVHVYHNSDSLFAGNVVDGLTSLTGPNYGTTLFLNQNDTIDFAVGVGSNNNLFYDSTGIMASLTAVPEPAACLVWGGMALAGFAVAYFRRAAGGVRS